ncbi:glycosyltransferase family 4 protein [Mucilaginibacter sp. ZT4R22]|uniref:Glycosyltransferase family 4 protein n=1 Tax=Mucilaginibacter pankratovii TaxID=2772110 RepID=A0ABR7WRH2_9SPHI|nr:glycosyltransferase family 4 protein [Mucilaginibacter pankratovii]MBD1363964.1 glycosyltransferase family 4 protein [Mucilaginibacter pankratovii]
MKIAIIVNPLIPVPPEKYGGIERIVYMLIQELIAKGHDVTLYANERSKPGCALVGYHESDHYGLPDMIRINALTSKIAFKKFDVIHTFGRMSNIALLMLSKLPKVVSYQLQPTLSQVKKVIKFAREGSVHFTGCSDYISNQIVPYAPVTTIYNGVDTAEYTFTPAVADDAPLVFLGRIQKEKGTDIAIQTALATGRKLVIAGNVPDETIHQAYFEEKVKPFIDGKQVTYIGPVNNSQKNELLGAAAAFLMPVTWDEPFGIVMAEALACGTPVIGFKRGSVPEVVQHGVNGFLCDTREEMAAFAKDIPKINRADCRRIAEGKFSSDTIGNQYEELYKRMVAK